MSILLDLEQNSRIISKHQLYIECKTEIEKLIDFLNSLSFLIYNLGHAKTCISGNKVYVFQTEIIDAAVKTLNSIKYCCMFGSFSDANVLVRKYRDDLFLFLYIVEALNNRKYLDEEQIREIVGDGLDVNKWIEVVELTLNVAVSGITKNNEDKRVDAWLDDSVHKLSKEEGYKLSIGNYMDYLKKNSCIKEVIAKYNLKKDWENIRNKLNDYVHNKGKTYTRHNLMSINSSDIKKCFKEIISRLNFITTFFMVLLILIDSKMIESTDYINYLDCGLTPPEDSQYQIAPFVQEFIDNYINKLHPELKVFSQVLKSV